MFFFQKNKPKPEAPVQAKPKERKPSFSLLSKSVMIPGAIIAGIFIFIATGFGIFRLFSFSRKKKEKTKQTKLDN